MEGRGEKGGVGGVGKDLRRLGWMRLGRVMGMRGRGREEGKEASGKAGSGEVRQRRERGRKKLEKIQTRWNVQEVGGGSEEKENIERKRVWKKRGNLRKGREMRG